MYSRYEWCDVAMRLQSDSARILAQPRIWRGLLLVSAWPPDVAASSLLWPSLVSVWPPAWPSLVSAWPPAWTSLVSAWPLAWPSLVLAWPLNRRPGDTSESQGRRQDDTSEGQAEARLIPTVFAKVATRGGGSWKSDARKRRKCMLCRERGWFYRAFSPLEC